MKHQLNKKKVEIYKLSLWDEAGETANVRQLEGLKEDKKKALI